MKCFYHSADLDGVCSGAIVHQAFPECEMIGFDYGQQVPWASIKPGEVVYMVDVSLPPHEMKRLNEAAQLVWIDHHADKIDAVLNIAGPIAGTQIVGLSACEQTWMNLHALPMDSLPRAVRLLGRWDVWEHDWHADVVPFQFGMLSFHLKPESYQWRVLLMGDDRELVTECVIIGHRVMAFEKANSARLIEQYGFEGEILGHRTLFINRPNISSYAFESRWNPEHHDLMCGFAWKDGQWRVSLRTTKPEVNCARIAQEFGGNGHPMAARFTTKVFPFWGEERREPAA